MSASLTPFRPRYWCHRSSVLSWNFNLTRCRSLESFSSPNLPTKMKTHSGVINYTAAQTESLAGNPITQNTRVLPQIHTSVLCGYRWRWLCGLKPKCWWKTSRQLSPIIARLSSFPEVLLVYADSLYLMEFDSKQLTSTDTDFHPWTSTSLRRLSVSANNQALGRLSRGPKQNSLISLLFQRANLQYEWQYLRPGRHYPLAFSTTWRRLSYIFPSAGVTFWTSTRRLIWPTPLRG